jgi:uncharacterized protein YijF (DUF1287 family)/L,D-peptidoglycan transpeptidase YkuD (ErfK/YbiS/YcfS/YnhG family)
MCFGRWGIQICALLLAADAGAAGYRVPIKDRGVFSDLDARVRLHVPAWLRKGPALVLSTARPGVELLVVAGVPVAFCSARGDAGRDARPNPPNTTSRAPTPGCRVRLGQVKGWPRLRTRRLGKANDADGDGIPDALDVLIGGKKAVLNRAAYTEGYRRLPFPGGDVPRRIGVCTDVVVRALRNAGYDLQVLVQRDIKRARRAYRGLVRRPDASIDHRRVRTLLPFFKRRWRRLPADPDGRAEPLLPGDIVFLNTMGDAAPDHIGIVSDRLGSSGRPLIINNWTVGHRTAEMDLLGFVPLTHRFRLPGRPFRLKTKSARGPAGLLARRGVTLDAAHRQMVLVNAPLWSSSGGELRRYLRKGRRWRQIGSTLRVRIGSAGLGRGRGLHKGSALAGGPEKREGDRRSPAGVFALGTALGHGRRPFAGRWPWRQVDARDRLVDDPRSPHYNTWQRAPLEGREPWRSAEKLIGYRLALRVKHNADPVKPGAGSAIFVHLPVGQDGPTVGCTTLPRRRLIELLGWLRRDRRPVLVQLPGMLLP